jgi:hypothetical protein
MRIPRHKVTHVGHSVSLDAVQVDQGLNLIIR